MRQTWVKHIADIHTAAADATGRRVVVATPRGMITVLDGEGGDLVDTTRVEVEYAKVTQVEVASDGTYAVATAAMANHGGDQHVELYVRRPATAPRDLAIDPDCGVDYWSRPWALSPDGACIAYVWASEDDFLPTLVIRSTTTLATDGTLVCGEEDEVVCEAAAIDAGRELAAVAGERIVYARQGTQLRTWAKPAPIDRLVFGPTPDTLWAVTEARRTVWIFDAAPVRGARLSSSVTSARFLRIDRDAKIAAWLTDEGVVVEQRLTDGLVRTTRAVPELARRAGDVVCAAGAHDVIVLRDHTVGRLPLPEERTDWAAAD